MDETRIVCACGGALERSEDELTGKIGDPICASCGAVLRVCIGCGQAPPAWAVKDSVCEECGAGYVNGDVNIHLSDSQQSELLVWAEARQLLPE